MGNKFTKKLLLASIAFVLSTPVTAKSIPDIYKLVPSNSLVTIDMDVSNSAWKDLASNKSLKNFDLVKSFFSKPLSFISQNDLKSVISDNILVTFSDNYTVSDEPSIQMVFKFKNTKSRDLVKASIKNKFSKQKNAQIVAAKYKTADIISIIPKDTKFEPYYFGFIDDSFVMTNSSVTIKDSIQAFYGNGEALIKNSDFMLSYYKITPESQFKFFMDTDKFYKSLSKEKGFSKLADLKDLSYLSASLNIKKDHLELNSYTTLDSNSKTLSLLDKNDVSSFKDLISMSPKDLIGFLAFSQKSMKASLKYEDAEANELGNMMKTATGIDFGNFFKNNSGDVGLVITNTKASPLFPSIALLMIPDNKSKMTETLSKFSLDTNMIKDKERGKRKKLQETNKAEALTFSETLNYKGNTIFTTKENKELQPMGIRPSYSYLDNYLVLGTSPEVIGEISDLKQSKARDFSLYGNQKFNKSNDIIGFSGNSLGFINLAPIISLVGALGASEKKSDNNMISNLKKIHGMAFSSKFDGKGSFSKIILLADIDKIDFSSLTEIPTTAKKSLKTYY